MQHESLKRVSAQLGLKILESDRLSGEKTHMLKTFKILVNYQHTTMLML